MSILLINPNRDMTPFRDALLALDLNLDVDIWPNVVNKNRVNFVVAWDHPDHILNSFPNLKVVSSLGAGVDHLLRDNSIPEGTILTRLVDSSLKRQMSDYVETSCYNILRRFEDYFRQKQTATWKRLPHYQKKDLHTGVLGLGEIGAYTAVRLAGNGWQVNGWARTSKNITGVKSFAGEEEKRAFLSESNIVISLLPLTPETEGVLSLDLFKQLKKPSFLINVARGKHLIEEDLIYALDAGILSGAVLDVFENEPLPESHPFWNHPKITITPHVASVTEPKDLAEHILNNYKRMLSGQKLEHMVDRKRGY